jgi:hypothetical protein
MAVMPSCPSCGAERSASANNAGCEACGAPSASVAPAVPTRVAPRAPGRAAAAVPAAAVDMRPAGTVAAPDFQLDVPKRPAPKVVAPRKVEAEVTLELAVEPRSFAPTVARKPSSADSNAVTVIQPAQALIVQGARAEIVSSVGDVAFDAQLLADFGAAPSHWLLSPIYAWRVLKRQRELKKGLAVRRDEAKRAATEVEDALVAFAERVRPMAEKQSEMARNLEELRGAEDVLRSRDRVLAAEQDAQSARLAAVDARLAKFEAELAHAQAEERTIASDLASAQPLLARGESKLKRAESELRSAQQREAEGPHG